jgi:hypothetical protein
VHVLVEPYDDAVAPLVAHRPEVVLADGSDAAMAAALGAADHPPRAAIWHGHLPEGPDIDGDIDGDLDWDVLLRAGRTDPAPVAEVHVTADAFVIEGRTLTLAQVLEDDGAAWPLDAIATLLDGGPVLVSAP